VLVRVIVVAGDPGASLSDPGGGDAAPVGSHATTPACEWVVFSPYVPPISAPRK